MVTHSKIARITGGILRHDFEHLKTFIAEFRPWLLQSFWTVQTIQVNDTKSYVYSISTLYLSALFKDTLWSRFEFAWPQTQK